MYCLQYIISQSQKDRYQATNKHRQQQIMQFTLKENTSQQTISMVNQYKQRYGIVLFNNMLINGYQQKVIQSQKNKFVIDQANSSQIISSIKTWDIPSYSVYPINKHIQSFINQNNSQTNNSQTDIITNNNQQQHKQLINKISQRYNNIIKSISHIQFINLNLLQLSECNLYSIESISYLNCPNLIFLDLNNNKITIAKSLIKFYSNQLSQIYLYQNYVLNGQFQRFKRISILQKPQYSHFNQQFRKISCKFYGYSQQNWKDVELDYDHLSTDSSNLSYKIQVDKSLHIQQNYQLYSMSGRNNIYYQKLLSRRQKFSFINKVISQNSDSYWFRQRNEIYSDQFRQIIYHDYTKQQYRKQELRKLVLQKRQKISQLLKQKKYQNIYEKLIEQNEKIKQIKMKKKLNKHKKNHHNDQSDHDN